MAQRAQPGAAPSPLSTLSQSTANATADSARDAGASPHAVALGASRLPRLKGRRARSGEYCREGMYVTRSAVSQPLKVLDGCPTGVRSRGRYAAALRGSGAAATASAGARSARAGAPSRARPGRRRCARNARPLPSSTPALDLETLAPFAARARCPPSPDPNSERRLNGHRISRPGLLPDLVFRPDLRVNQAQLLNLER